jgi:hypothetical protein
MRKLVYDTLINSTQAGDRVYSASTLGTSPNAQGTAPLIPARPGWPFIIVRFMPEVPYVDVDETSDASDVVCQVYVYDDRGSYTLIDEVMKECRDLLKALTGIRSASGAFCMRSKWEGVSQDFFDEQYQSNVRFGTVRLTSSN